MKKILVLLLFTTLFFYSEARQSSIKIGGNYNADYITHKSGKISYPSWEISYEKSIGKKFSFNVTYNYAKQEYVNNFLENIAAYGATNYIDYNHSLILEGRYYIKPDYTGLFFQAGIPFTYITEKTVYSSASGTGSYLNNYYAISTIAGFGINYPLSKSCNIEMSINISPSLNFLDLDYGTSGFIKSGVRFSYSLSKASK